MLYKEQLRWMIDELKNRRSWLEEELKLLPLGFIHIQKTEDREFYSRHIPKGGNRKKERREGISKDSELISDLVRKRYITKALKIIEQDLRILEKAFDKYNEFDENSVMSNFVAEHPNLKGAIFRKESIDKEWASNYNRAESKFENDLTSITSGGIPMRSRGEIIIAEKLKEYGIPFRYEMEIGHPDIPYVPDFTIRRPKDGKIFFWEHFGDVNDSNYMSRNRMKLSVYEDYGIVPWDNLIITYDTRAGGVNTPLIEAMIHAWLL